MTSEVVPATLPTKTNSESRFEPDRVTVLSILCLILLGFAPVRTGGWITVKGYSLDKIIGPELEVTP